MLVHYLCFMLRTTYIRGLLGAVVAGVSVSAAPRLLNCLEDGCEVLRVALTLRAGRAVSRTCAGVRPSSDIVEPLWFRIAVFATTEC